MSDGPSTADSMFFAFGLTCGTATAAVWPSGLPMGLWLPVFLAGCYFAGWFTRHVFEAIGGDDE